MTTMARLLEVVSGTPHKQDNAKQVNDATNQLVASADRLTACIKPYAESEDPLAMILTDIFNQRAMMEDGHAEAKFHP